MSNLCKFNKRSICSLFKVLEWWEQRHASPLNTCFSLEFGHWPQTWAPGLSKLLVIIEDKEQGVSEQVSHQLRGKMWFSTLFRENTQECCKQGFLGTSKHFQLSQHWSCGGKIAATRSCPSPPGLLPGCAVSLLFAETWWFIHTCMHALMCMRACMSTHSLTSIRMSWGSFPAMQLYVSFMVLFLTSMKTRPLQFSFNHGLRGDQERGDNDEKLTSCLSKSSNAKITVLTATNPNYKCLALLFITWVKCSFLLFPSSEWWWQDRQRKSMLSRFTFPSPSERAMGTTFIY